MADKHLLGYDTYFHVFNRGNNRQPIFFEERNYIHFMDLYSKYIHPIANTFTYCLLPNHFHFLVRLKSEEEVNDQPGHVRFSPSRAFANLFIAYSKAINLAYGRTGSLFEKNFNHIAISSESHLINLVFYIHYNPQKHGYVDDYQKWHWSSYQALSSQTPTRLQRDTVVSWFGNIEDFHKFHQGMMDEKKLEGIILE